MGTPTTFFERLRDFWKHRHSTSMIVGAGAAIVMWYLGDLGITGAPPTWVMVAGAFVAGGVTTAVVQEVKAARPNDESSAPQ
jgi:hypothetical protein